MTGQYDAIVLGLGVMGAAAAYHLARRGQRVLGLDAHLRGHALGSSHGRTRIIRQAYYQGPGYVPLVRHAYTLWRELEAVSGRELLTITGGLMIGEPESAVVTGARGSALAHGLPYEELTAGEVTARFPGFRLTDDQVAIYEPAAGFLAADACLEAHLDLAARHGAELRHGEPVYGWSGDGAGVRVETDGGSFGAERLIIAAGPWAGGVLADLGLPLEVERIVNVHFEPTRPELFGPDRCPIHIWHLPEGYYGFPALPGQGLKFGRHSGEPCAPERVRREVDQVEIDELRAVLDRYMPGSAGVPKWAVTCLYTNTPDRDFVIDRHPAHEQVVYACGFSGHGFKFAPVIGEVLADLALTGATPHPIAFLSASRFAAPALVS